MPGSRPRRLAPAPGAVLALALSLAASLPAARALAQPSDRGAPSLPAPPPEHFTLLGEPVVSGGQPPLVDLRWGPLAGYDFDRRRLTARMFLSAAVPPPVLLPRELQLGLEAGAGASGPHLHASAGLWLGLPWLAAGVRRDFPRRETSFGLSLRFPFHRGGLLHRGDMLRIDHHPARGQLEAGLTLSSPFSRYRVTRHLSKAVPLPRGSVSRRDGAAPDSLPPPVERCLERIEHAVLWMDRLTTPRFRTGDDFYASAREYREHIAHPDHTLLAEERTYHSELEAAFAGVLDGDVAAGLALARLAERTIFEQVLVPYNRRFGQEKEPEDAGGYAALALEAFDEQLRRRHALAAGESTALIPGHQACREVFRRVLEDVVAASVQARRRWGQRFLMWSDRARLAWLPLRYGLRPDQYDTQAEWDSVLATVAGQPFTDANDVEYAMLERFHVELKTMIRRTREYQVTIVHDFRAFTTEGDTDIYGWDIVADGYLAAFRHAVRELDEGRRERLPQFFLFLDQHYYGRNRERGIVSFLENLATTRSPRLRNREIEQQVADAHRALMEALADSPRLRGLSSEERQRLFKVHVTITYPLDPAFGLDLAQRDHRKLAFRDVREDDPASGAAIFTGEGVGAHYNGAGWEDRSILVRGSCLVQLKSETRQLFLEQGFREDEVPPCLRPRAYPRDHQARCDSLRAAGWTTPTSLVMNETGYGYKKASVLKAAMYDLMPANGVLMCFDSMWLSELWAGMFVSAALRGAQMMPVAPVPHNAPNASPMLLYFMRNTMAMMLQASQYFAADIARAGGQLRVGLYAHNAPTNDLARRIRAMQRGRENYPFLKELFPIPADVERQLGAFAARYDPMSILYLQPRPRPRLHLKFQVFATEEALSILHQSEWGPVLMRYTEVRQKQLMSMRTPGLTRWVLYAPDSTPPGVLIPAFQRSLDGRGPQHRDRVLYTFTVGSHNQNSRSLLLDGESLVTVSGYNGLVMAVDFVFIVGITEWPRGMAEFEMLYPRSEPGPFARPFYALLKDLN